MTLVGIIGSGETTLNNASDLLRDYLDADGLVYIPSYITSDSMRIVAQWLKEQEYYLERVKRQELLPHLLDEPDKATLIVLGIPGSEDIIEDCMDEGIPVLDLTRGLYQVGAAEMALDGSVSHAETLPAVSGTPDQGASDLVSMALTEPHMGDAREVVERWILETVKILVKEVSNLHARVATLETNWEPAATPLKTPGEVLDYIEERYGSPEANKTRYYQNGKGKLRKAGRSKMKPGEKEVYLTEEEVESLTS